MAIIAVEGFDVYSGKTGTDIGLASRWTVGGNTNGSMQTGHFGIGQCLRYDNPTSTPLKDQLNLGAGYASLGISFTMRVETVSGDWGTAGTGEALLAFYDSANAVQCSLHLDTAGHLFAFRGLSVTNLGGSSGAAKIKTLHVHQVEIEVTISDAAGVFKVWVDGTLVINLTSIDTKTTAVADAQYFTLCPTHGLDTYLEFDNLIITDGTRPGVGRRVQPLAPTAETADADFVPSTGTDNSALVDETPVNTTDYVQGSTVGDLDLYDIADLDAAIGTVEAVDLFMYALKNDVTAREIRATMKSNATFASSANLVLTTAYQQVRKLQLTNPDGGGAWSAAALNALKIGPEVMV